MAIIFNVTTDTTNADKSDQQAAQLAVEEWNGRNPGSEKPTTPNSALLQSYQEVLEEDTLQTTHTSFIDQSGYVSDEILVQAYRDADEATQDQVDALLGINQ